MCSKQGAPTNLPLGKLTNYSLNRRQDEPQSRSERTWEEKNLFPLCWDLNADLTVCKLVACLSQNLVIWKLNLNIMKRRQFTCMWLLTAYEEILQVSCSWSGWTLLGNQQMFQRWSISSHIRRNTFRSAFFAVFWIRGCKVRQNAQHTLY